MENTWGRCAAVLQDEMPSQQFNTWNRPLVPQIRNGCLHLLAPNRFICDWVAEKFLLRIQELLQENGMQEGLALGVNTQSKPLFSDTNQTSQARVTANTSPAMVKEASVPAVSQPRTESRPELEKADVEGGLQHRNYLNHNFVFENFVEGKSNQLGLAAAHQVAENPGGAKERL